jgi:hypothetical protein
MTWIRNTDRFTLVAANQIAFGCFLKLRNRDNKFTKIKTASNILIGLAPVFKLYILVTTNMTITEEASKQISPWSEINSTQGLICFERNFRPTPNLAARCHLNIEMPRVDYEKLSGDRVEHAFPPWLSFS